MRSRVLSGGPRAIQYTARALFVPCSVAFALDSNLHFLSRRLIELRIEHADLDASVDRLVEAPLPDELMLRRLKKRRLRVRDEMRRLEQLLEPREPA